MRMQHSHFTEIIEEDHKNPPLEFELSGPTSEWLFQSQFWKKFNDAYGTMFDQYEEDALPEDLLPHLARVLQQKIISVDEKMEEDIEFIFGWDEKKAPLYCKLQRSALVSELNSLHNYLEKIQGRGRSVFLSL